MNRALASLTIALLLATAGTANADLRVAGATGAPVAESAGSGSTAGGLLAATESAGPLDPLSELSLPVDDIADDVPLPFAHKEGGEVEELPGLPGSANLFLSAALSVGAWQVVRRSRDIHLGALPEWYHPDAPHQIGHSVAFDMEYAPLVACPSFIEPSPERAVHYHPWRDFSAPCASQHFLNVEAPRGPPLV